MDDGLWHRQQALNFYTLGQALKNEVGLTQSQGESSLNPEAKEFVPSFKSSERKEFANLDIKEFVGKCKNSEVKEFVPSSKSSEVKEFVLLSKKSEVKEFVPSYKKLEAKARETKELVPSYKQKSAGKETASTSRHGDRINDANKSQRNMQEIYIQRQIFEFLTELGDEQMPLDTVVVALLPNGRGLNVKFTTKECVGGKHMLDEALCRDTCLALQLSEPEVFASKPEIVFVNQFLIRVNDQLSEKLEHTHAVVTPKGRMNRHRSYTELEIEQQIEGIKLFDNFFSYTESMRTQDRVTQLAFKELFHSLGMISHRSCAATPVESPRKSGQPYPKAAMVDDADEEEVFASCNNSEFEGDDITLCGKQLETDRRQYMRDNRYRFEDDNGLQLVNQLSEADLQEVMPNDLEQCGPPSTPAICQKLAYKAPKSQPSAARKNPRLNQKERVSTVSQEMSQTSAVTKKLQSERQTQLIATGVHAKTHQRVAKTGAAALSQPSGSMAARVVSGRSAAVTQKQPVNLANQASGTESANNRGGATATKTKSNTQGGSKKMQPRSTHASMMRQLEVKRRLSLMHGDSEHDLLYNDYLFK
ncbi:uncharacterized protein LOC117584838 [Drosophila guanche]|uniref:Uncharacterized protein n=1 Tax=Drosophila guanche TaxID=7266 RepID=A0A3B0KEA8_DROGU|nr:uncharacterized protein LOC117584838 [Drosophila guanche]SPP81998.1 Hypothetical predicted protein [Drosophila guanche]